MKLFVWANPYHVPYGRSMLIAVAETEEDARIKALDAPGYCYEEYPDNSPDRSAKLGPPTRVVELPCAEWHKWSE